MRILAALALTLALSAQHQGYVYPALNKPSVQEDSPVFNCLYNGNGVCG